MHLMLTSGPIFGLNAASKVMTKGFGVTYSKNFASNFKLIKFEKTTHFDEEFSE